MEIEVRLFTTLRKGRFKKRFMDLPDGARLRGLPQQLSQCAMEVEKSP